MKLRVLLLLILISCSPVFADIQQVPTQTTTNLPATSTQNVSFSNCTKMFSMDKETLFYLTIAAVKANRFSIEEIQSTNGYVMFVAARNKYIATIAGIDDKNSILKITPCNNVYVFQPGIISNMFKFIEINQTVKQ